MPLVLGGSAIVIPPYTIDNSCKFNQPDEAELARTLGTPTDLDKWTCSFWLKIVSIGEHGVFDVHGDASNYGFFELGTSGQLTIFQRVGGVTTCTLVTSSLFKDPAAWYHFVVVWDSGNVTEADRVIIYTNGVRETSFSTSTYPAQDADSATNSANPHTIGAKDTNVAHNYDGYMAEFVFCDGQAYAASDFGQFNSDSPTIWEPKDVSGLTFGDNGFIMDYEDSAALGNDVSGNNNDFTPANLAAADQCVDSPTNNLATLNPLLMPATSLPVFSDGNDVVVTQPGAPATGHYMGGFSAYGMSSGLWYVEVKGQVIGTALVGISGSRLSEIASRSFWLGGKQYEWAYYSANGIIYANGTDGPNPYGASFATGDIIGIYLDLDANKLYFAKNGAIQYSGVGLDVTAVTVNGQPNTYFFSASQFGSSPGVSTFNWNFGNGTFASTAVTSSNADANGFGLFEYSPNDGGSASFDSSAKDFLCLCSKNVGSDGG